MRKTYKKHNGKNRRKAGTKTRISAVRELVDSIPGPDLAPFILEPLASTTIKHSIKSHLNRKEYTRTILRFYTNLVLFNNVLLRYNATEESKALAITSLLKTIPVGLTIEAFLEVPEIATIITRLRATLSDPGFSFPERDTQPYIELKELIDEIITLITGALQRLEIPIPLIIQRQKRLETRPLDIGGGRRIKSRRNKSLRNKSLRNKLLRNKSLRNKSLRNKRRK